MSNETKRDVFEAVWNRLAGYQVFFNGWPREAIDEYKKRYDAALPDDLPVIPQAVGEYIQWGKSYDIQLYMMYSFKFIHSQGLKKLTDDVESWIISSSNTFARAWVLGVWKVAETGEVVKL
ncbi:hypothetical protein LACSTY_000790 [Lacticaseibacillus styriensis]|uniref:DUF1642 domain-containing protein n=2 Tax=Lacticaseibacillus TaxID=2759736 RepID=A0AAN1C7C7_LACCA|nr:MULTISPECIES: hypothetical protein [Lacticaseibacillus]ARY90941.1 hypothetical protein BGL52_03955 [Lacticaseibacillus casei]WLV81554.1 hypothetical protein LACSTY_000790 [Lacticaseibacillus sp. NCIMB 15473]